MLFRPGLVGRMPCPGDWYVSSGAPTINDDFTAGALPAGWVFSRASGATDSTWQDNPNQQTYNTLANNVPLINQWGLKTEPAATNFFLNSDAPVTQSIAFVANNTYAVWIVGPGSVTLSNGTGTFTNLGTVTNGAPIRGTCVTTGTMTVTVTGTVYRVQVEKSFYPTSYIASGATAQARAATQISKNYFGGQLNVNNGTYWMEVMHDAVATLNNETILQAGNGSFSSSDNCDLIRILSAQNNVATFSTFVGSTESTRVQSPDAYVNQRIDRIAASYDPLRLAMCTNYSNVVSASGSGRPPTLLAVTLGSGGSGNAFSGYIRGFRYWPTTMSDSELHECTGPGYYAGKPVFDLDGTVANQWRMWTNAALATGTGQPTDATFDQPAGTAINTFPAAATQNRITSRGLLTDPQRNNYINNSPLASGSTPSLTVQTFIWSMRGTGTVTITPGTGQTDTPMPVVLSGGPPNNWKPINVTVAGTFNYAISGSVDYLQCEQAGTLTAEWTQGPSSFIKGTAAQNRLLAGPMLPIGPWWNTQGTYYLEVLVESLVSGTYMLSAENDTVGDREQIFAANSVSGHSAYGFNTISGGGTYNYGRIDIDPSQQPFPTLQWVKVAASYSTDRKRQFCMNGVLGSLGSGITETGPSVVRPAATKFYIGRNGVSNNGPPMVVRRVRYYDYAIFDDALKAMTAGADLDLSFMSATLDSRITVTRAGATATVVDQTGTILTIGANTPRLDYDPITHAVLGTLIEEARTNQLLRSGDFSNASWTKASCTLSAAVTAPDGGTTAYGVIPNNAAIGFLQQGGVNATGGTAYTLSCFLKAGTQTQALVYLAGSAWNDATNRTVTFNLTGSGSIATTTGNGTTGTIKQYPNGWYRCTMTVTPDVTGVIGNHVAQSVANGDGTSVAFYAWGAQFEAGAFPTTYIPTTTAAATRNADVVSMPTSPAWFVQGLGTLVVEAMQTTTMVGNGWLAGLGIPSAADEISIFNSNTVSGQMIFKAGGTIINNRTVNGIYALNRASKTGIAWQAGSVSWATDGVIRYSNDPISGAIPSMPSLMIGQRSSSLGQLNGYVRRVRYWGRTMADTELQSVTT